MHEVVGQNPVDKKADPIKAGAPHGKLATIVVIRRHTRQSLSCAQRIPDQNARQFLQFTLIKRLLRGNTGFGTLKWTSSDSNILRQCCSALVERNFSNTVVRLGDRDRLLHQSERY